MKQEDPGYIHSIETLGTLDGPGIRLVIFMQGCPLRCVYCHNPDTWSQKNGRAVTSSEILTQIQNYLPYITPNQGGVTFSGGEPLMQAGFLTGLFQKMHQLNIHKALDTSGYAEVEEVKDLLAYTDLVLLSLKHPDPQKHQDLTGQLPYKIQRFIQYLQKAKIPLWIRYVLIPGLTDGKEDLTTLARFLNTLSNLQRVELLPYHEMGVKKWEKLGLNYALPNILPPTEDQILAATAHLSSQLSPKIQLV